MQILDQCMERAADTGWHSEDTFANCRDGAKRQGFQWCLGNVRMHQPLQWLELWKRGLSHYWALLLQRPLLHLLHHGRRCSCQSLPQVKDPRAGRPGQRPPGQRSTAQPAGRPAERPTPQVKDPRADPPDGPPTPQVKDPWAGQPAGRPSHRLPRSKIHGLARNVFENPLSQAVGRNMLVFPANIRKRCT